MNDIMVVVRIASKGRMLDILERFYIYRETKFGTQINDNPTPSSRHSFKTILTKGINSIHNKDKLIRACSASKELYPNKPTWQTATT